MYTKAFSASLITVDEMLDEDSFVVGLSETRDGSGQAVILARRISPFTKEDKRAGLDTYSISFNSGETDYGGVDSVSLDDHRLELHFRKGAAKYLRVSAIEIDLGVDDIALARLRTGLRRVFPAGDRPRTFAV